MAERSRVRGWHFLPDASTGSNELRFSPNLAVSERVIFPVSSNESNGIEDTLFVRFVDDDGTALYYAT